VGKYFLHLQAYLKSVGAKKVDFPESWVFGIREEVDALKAYKDAIRILSEIYQGKRRSPLLKRTMRIIKSPPPYRGFKVKTILDISHN
jgi:hypothetical protein